MSAKLYVGNLDYGVDDSKLAKLFAKAGSVISAIVITDRYSGRSKGFGFVEMGSREEAQKAIKMFNGREFEGREMVVNEARPRRQEGFQRKKEPKSF